MKIKLTFKIVEYHTIEREVDPEWFDEYTSRTASLEEMFRDDEMPDADISTESVELDAWEVCDG